MTLSSSVRGRRAAVHHHGPQQHLVQHLEVLLALLALEVGDMAPKGVDTGEGHQSRGIDVPPVSNHIDDRTITCSNCSHYRHLREPAAEEIPLYSHECTGG